eukprot:scaffold24708_cov67-Phaeocystis_antarctica.AAC.5
MSRNELRRSGRRRRGLRPGGRRRRGPTRGTGRRPSRQRGDACRSARRASRWSGRRRRDQPDNASGCLPHCPILGLVLGFLFIRERLPHLAQSPLPLRVAQAPRQERPLLLAEDPDPGGARFLVGAELVARCSGPRDDDAAKLNTGAEDDEAAKLNGGVGGTLCMTSCCSPSEWPVELDGGPGGSDAADRRVGNESGSESMSSTWLVLPLLAVSYSLRCASSSFRELSSSRKERCITSFTWTLICRSRLARSREMRRLASFRKPRA